MGWIAMLLEEEARQDHKSGLCCMTFENVGTRRTGLEDKVWCEGEGWQVLLCNNLSAWYSGQCELLSHWVR